MENKVQMPVLLYSIDLRLYRNAVPVVLTDLNKCAKLFEGHSTQMRGDISVEEGSAELLSLSLSLSLSLKGPDERAMLDIFYS